MNYQNLLIKNYSKLIDIFYAFTNHPS